MRNVNISKTILLTCQVCCRVLTLFIYGWVQCIIERNEVIVLQMGIKEKMNRENNTPSGP